MSLSVTTFGEGEKVTEKPGPQKDPDEVREGGELLGKKTDQESLPAMKNVRKNKSGVLHAFRRKKWCKNHIMKIKCDLNVTKSTPEHLRATSENKVIEDVTEDDGAEEAAAGAGVEFTEMDFMTELERLEKNLDEILEVEDLNEDDGVKETCTKMSPTPPPSTPAMTEEEELEEALEYLRRWLSSL